MRTFSILTPGQLGPVLRGFRREQKITQKELGDRAGLDQSAISQIETRSGPVSLDRIARVLSALNLEIVVQSKGEGARASRSRW